MQSNSKFKVTYGFNVRLRGQTEDEFKLQQAICEALIDTGVKSIQVIDSLRRVVPKEYHIIVDRKGARVNDIRFSLGRLTVQEAYEVMPFSEWIHYSTDMNVADVLFVQNKLKEHGKKFHDIFSDKSRNR